MPSNTNIFMKGGNGEDAYSSISTPEGFNELKSALTRDVQLDQMFGGKRRRKSKSASKKSSRKGSKKGSKKSQKGGKRRRSASKKASKKRSSRSRKSQAGGKRRSRKASKGSKKASKKRSRKSRKSQAGGKRRSRKASKGSKKSSKRRRASRELPPALVAFRTLVKLVGDDSDLNLKGVAEPAKLAGMYKQMAASKHPNLDNIAVVEKAKEMFKADSLENKKKHLAAGRKEMAEKRAAKKEKKAASQEGGNYSETSDF